MKFICLFFLLEIALMSNFIDACLNWDPAARMTPLEALNHAWILDGLPPKVLLHHQRMFGLSQEAGREKQLHKAL